MLIATVCLNRMKDRGKYRFSGTLRVRSVKLATSTIHVSAITTFLLLRQLRQSSHDQPRFVSTTWFLYTAAEHFSV